MYILIIKTKLYENGFYKHFMCHYKCLVDIK